MSDAVRYLKREEIDTEKWDNCIRESSNGLIYGYSFYLDAMALNWDALVMGDYEGVMPLPWNKKYGIYYLYQPFFTASLGVFGKNAGEEKIKEFIRHIPEKFKLVEIDLNQGNNLSIPPASFQSRNNYILHIHKPYEEIFSGYRDHVKRNCKKAKQANCRYSNAVSIDEILQLSLQQMGKISKLSTSDYDRFKKLFTTLKVQGKALCCGVFTEQNELAASCVYFFSHSRAYYIMVGNHPDGKTTGASHYLIDRFIFEQAGKNLTIDFEGSDNKNLAFFYSSFGAELETYPRLTINRLPWWAKLFKKSSR